MKRVLIVGIVVFVLFAATVSAATVTETGSGITRGSIEYEFTYNPNDTAPTVISGVRPNDVLGVIYGRTSGGLPIMREYFMKSQLGSTWNYDVLHGQSYLSIALGQRVPVDLNNDNKTDLYLEFTNVSFKGGTFTFYNANALPAATNATAENTTANTTVPAENTTTAENVTAPVNATVTQNETRPTEPVVPSEPATSSGPGAPATQSSPLSSTLIFLIVLLVILLVLVLGAFFIVRRPKPKRRKPAKTAEKKTGPEEGPADEPEEEPDDDFDDESSLAHLEKPLPKEPEEPAPQPKLPSMVTRSSRVRRR